MGGVSAHTKHQIKHENGKRKKKKNKKRKEKKEPISIYGTALICATLYLAV